VGTALWLPNSKDDNIPEYTVVSRENSVVTPKPSLEFAKLLKANREMLEDVRHFAENVFVCTFDEECGDSNTKRTQFHVSQWSSRQAAGNWMKGSQAHTKILDLINDQPTVNFQPSVLASYERVRGRSVYKCPETGQIRYK
jgi:hypothetical protein